MICPLRHSLRYIDLLTLYKEPDLSALQLHIQLGTYMVKNIPLQMRMELLENNYLHVIQIATPSQVHLPEGNLNGSVVDLEIFPINTSENWN
ncbi:hypothetical protein Spica_0536 [Gracilinema caldarium DSM 7334]|uniref:Uncharacterized protein n=1 Tax=Gracilinema caldarium (strain ATCC 51460 / DSM 7334 / H1) TaxID=744872 RepID=F8F044_GRAC1|nr:hypothetical protein Spica_0536 [Gracilinema caldarium DSM 7334]